MKGFAALCLCLLPITLLGDKLQTFTSPDGVFQFKYSDLLVRCTEQRHEDGYAGWWDPDSCQAFIPVCDDLSRGSNTLVCFAYPKARFKDYPTFGAAAFLVAEIKGATEEVCLRGDPDWVTAGSAKTANINHVKFTTYETDGVATGHSLEGRVYRNFHGNKCYELSTRITSTSSGIMDGPVKGLTRKDWDEVNARLEQALHSFKFIK